MGICIRQRSKRWVLAVLSVVLVVAQVYAEDKPFSIALKGSFTTASQLFPNPHSPDEAERAQFFSLKDIWGIGIELRYRFPETDLAIALSSDYLRASRSSAIRLSGGEQIPVEDGYRVVPVELTGYFLIPLSGDPFGIYMGGGAGAYFGRRIYRLANVEAPALKHDVGFGIHVLSGVSYRFTDLVRAFIEMKFRDLQFTSVNQFTSPTIHYGSVLVPVSTQPFDSRVHTDGIILQFGVVLAF